jgi:hypothetical protein
MRTSQAEAVKAEVKAFLKEGHENVTVVETSADIPKSIAKKLESNIDNLAGIYDPVTNKVYIVASNIKNNTHLRQVIVHEAGHYLLRNNKHISKVLTNAIANLPSHLGADKMLSEIYRRVKAVDANPDIVFEETLMYYLQATYNPNQTWFKELVSKLKIAFAPYFKGIRVTSQDISNILVKEMQHSLSSKGVIFKTGPLASYVSRMGALKQQKALTNQSRAFLDVARSWVDKIDSTAKGQEIPETRIDQLAKLFLKEAPNEITPAPHDQLTRLRKQFIKDSIDYLTSEANQEIYSTIEAAAITAELMKRNHTFNAGTQKAEAVNITESTQNPSSTFSGLVAANVVENIRKGMGTKQAYSKALEAVYQVDLAKTNAIYKAAGAPLTGWHVFKQSRDFTDATSLSLVASTSPSPSAAPPAPDAALGCRPRLCGPLTSHALDSTTCHSRTNWSSWSRALVRGSRAWRRTDATPACSWTRRSPILRTHASQRRQASVPCGGMNASLSTTAASVCLPRNPTIAPSAHTTAVAPHTATSAARKRDTGRVGTGDGDVHARTAPRTALTASLVAGTALPNTLSAGTTLSTPPPPSTAPGTTSTRSCAVLHASRGAVFGNNTPSPRSCGRAVACTISEPLQLPRTVEDDVEGSGCILAGSNRSTSPSSASPSRSRDPLTSSPS